MAVREVSDVMHPDDIPRPVARPVTLHLAIVMRSSLLCFASSCHIHSFSRMN
jgi:hypothetical protein